MTNKDNPPRNIPVTQEHAKIREWASTLQSLTAANPDLGDLAAKLKLIGDGADASEVLGTKRRQGHSDSKEMAHFNTNNALTWIAGAMNKKQEGGLGLNLTKACIKASKVFAIDIDNLKRYWANKHKNIVSSSGDFDFDALRPSRSVKKP